MSRKTFRFDSAIYLRDVGTCLSQLKDIAVGEVLDEPVSQELICLRTHYGLVILIKEDLAFRALATPDLRLPKRPGVEPTDPYFRAILDNHRLEKGFYYGFQSLVRKYGIGTLEGLEFYALEHNAGAYLPLDWQQEVFRKSLEKVVLEYDSISGILGIPPTMIDQPLVV